MKLKHVYVIISEGNVIWVGASKNPNKRWYTLAWKGIAGELVVIERYREDWSEREYYWIKKCRRQGEPLQNIADGERTEGATGRHYNQRNNSNPHGHNRFTGLVGCGLCEASDVIA